MRVRPQFVAIVGGSGSGKTWLADRLQSELGLLAGRISLDSFYRDLSHRPFARRARVNFDHPRSIDWTLFIETLRRCNEEKKVPLPRYDFATHTRSKRSLSWQRRPLILVDGLWLLSRPLLRRMFALTLFLDCSEPLRLQRRIRRDVIQRNRTRASVREQFVQSVLPMHRRFVQPQRELAGVVLKRAPSRKQIASLARRIRSLVLPAP